MIVFLTLQISYKKVRIYFSIWGVCNTSILLFFLFLMKLHLILNKINQNIIYNNFIISLKNKHYSLNYLISYASNFNNTNKL